MVVVELALGKRVPIRLLLELLDMISGLEGVIMSVDEATAFMGDAFSIDVFDCMLSLRLSSSDIKSLLPAFNCKNI